MKEKIRLPNVWNEFIEYEAHRTSCSKSALIDKLIRKSIALHARQAEWIMKGDQFKVRICEEIKLSSILLEMSESGAFFITMKENKNYSELEKNLKALTSKKSHKVTLVNIFVTSDIFEYLDQQRSALGLSITFLISNAIQIALSLDAAFDTLTIGEKTHNTLKEIENTLINFITQNGQLQIGMRLVSDQKKVHLNNQDKSNSPVYQTQG